jgi:hypothetical protein
MPACLRIIGISLNALGAIILAIRVKSILDTLVMAQKANDINFRILVTILNGKRQDDPLIFGMPDHVERSQKFGIWLLFAGFLCIATGNILVGVSWYLEAA